VELWKSCVAEEIDNYLSLPAIDAIAADDRADIQQPRQMLSVWSNAFSGAFGFVSLSSDRT
jgi:hypothetical protein